MGRFVLEMERRKFIRLIGTVGTAFSLSPNLVACSPAISSIKTKIIGQNSKRGHAIRDNQIELNGEIRKIEIETVIVGGGITGLSTAYQLNKSNYSTFMLLELNDHVGGNSSSDKNAYSQFPLGAHYLTLPNPDNRPLIDFLKELKLILSETDGQQEYAEEFLCHAPDERLLFRGVFQEGLVPNYGVSEGVLKEIDRFFTSMNDLKSRRGNDGKFLFDIPIINASSDPILHSLDGMTFKAYLDKENYNSLELRWFLDYCCRDDFGAGSDRVSAWAGINYFAGRKSNPSNTIPSNILTWSEGNGYLVEKLKINLNDQIKSNVAVSKIVELADKIVLHAFDFQNKENLEITCSKAIIACPSYVTKHILQSPFWQKSDFDHYVHHPWLVASVILDKIPETNGGLTLAWDNVKFGTMGLGYIYNQNQSFQQVNEKYVISVYLAFDKEGDVAERKKMYSLSEQDMKILVLNELKEMHPAIEEHIEEISFQQWGHGMVTPYPLSYSMHKSFVEKNKVSNRLRLAHTDYSSYSIFEEGFSQGNESAKFILNS